jgi:hypothetical protein
MVRTITALATLGAPWLATMAISVGIACALCLAMTGGVTTTVHATDSVQSVRVQPVGSEVCVNGVRMVYIGQNSWIPDQNGAC